MEIVYYISCYDTKFKEFKYPSKSVKQTDLTSYKRVVFDSLPKQFDSKQRREMINHERQQDAFHLLDFQFVTPLDLKDIRYGILFYRLFFFILTFEWNYAYKVIYNSCIGVDRIVIFKHSFSESGTIVLQCLFFILHYGLSM